MPEVRITSVQRIEPLPDKQIQTNDTHVWIDDLAPNTLYRVLLIVDGKDCVIEHYSDTNGRLIVLST